jgi:hypothetical protein
LHDKVKRIDTVFGYGVEDEIVGGLTKLGLVRFALSLSGMTDLPFFRQ